MRLTGPSTWDTVVAQINTHDTPQGGIPANSTRFLFNGNAVGTVAHSDPVPSGALVQGLYFQRTSGGSFGSGENPIVDFDNLVISACQSICGRPVFDVNYSGQVDPSDLSNPQGNGFLDCVTGPVASQEVWDALSVNCQCLDVNGDHSIDMRDFAAFQRCLSTGVGSSGADPACAN